MELTLTRQSETQVLVTCDSQPSHNFDLHTLVPNDDEDPPHPLDNPVAYGKAIYTALFLSGTPSRHALEGAPERILLVCSDGDLDAIPWEYAYGRYGSECSEDFLVLECHFVRGLPVDKRIKTPKLHDGLHIIAVPSNPLSQQLEPLNIDGEWMRLKEIIQEFPYAISLERTRPPTLERLRQLVANQQYRVVHFMGHGGQDEKVGATLCFERDNGDLDLVTAKDFMRRVRGTVFLVTLNACASANPGSTPLSNLAAALVRQKIPYALGMRFSIHDEDARAFSRTFYNDLARGTPVEEALRQTRLTLATSSRHWIVGIPVLYTSLAQPASGFASLTGTPLIKEHQPRIEVSALPRAEGTFQGRIDELKALGTALTGDSRPQLLTIHGGGGQGKTALAREAVERFAYAWPGGVWAISLETLLSRELFVSNLARFLSIDTQAVADAAEIERLVIAQLMHSRTLIVLDNVETLVEAVETNNEEAIRLAQFLREQLPRPPVSLLATSRSFLGWPGEIGCELTGLAPIEGFKLFQQHAPQREREIDLALAWELSEKVEGHPLSLHLLGSAFNASTISFSGFVEEYEVHLLQAEDKYKDADHRQRTLYACIDTSVRYLDSDLCVLLSQLWIFHSPFLPETAVAIFDPQTEDTQKKRSPVYDQLYILWRHGLLTRETVSLRDGTLWFYRLLPTMRPYIEHFLARPEERETLLERFGVAYAKLVGDLSGELKRSGLAASMGLLLNEDLERGILCMTGVTQGYYLLNWGWILQWLGDRRQGLESIERALEIAQGQDRQLELEALRSMGVVYHNIGQPRQALALFEQALPIMREVGDRESEATTLTSMAMAYHYAKQSQQALVLLEDALSIIREVDDQATEMVILNNMARVYQDTEQVQRALTLFEQILPIRREVGDRAGEATTLHNIAGIYRDTGRTRQALELYEQALPIRREVGDRAGEALTLAKIADTYSDIGQPQRALALYEQTLSMMREVSNPVWEATAMVSMARVYQHIGQPQQALELYERALPTMRGTSDQPGKATMLSNMAETYHLIGKQQQARELYEQALSIRRELGNRVGEVFTLNGLAKVYFSTRQHQQALVLCELALSILRELGDRSGEASILANMATIYHSLGQLQQAMNVYEQTLSILRSADDRIGEAITLNNMAMLYEKAGQPQRALELYIQSLSILRENRNYTVEANTLANMAMALYQSLDRPQEGITRMEQAIAILRENGLAHDAAGRTVDDLRQILRIMRRGDPLDADPGSVATLPPEDLQQIIAKTVAAMTVAEDHYGEWREKIVHALQKAQNIDRPRDAEFFSAILLIIDEQAPTLPAGHPYNQAVAAIQAGITLQRQIASLSREVLQAVRDFVNAEDWETARHVVEVQQSLLFQPEVETLFEANIAQAKAAGDQSVAHILEQHLTILHECKTHGVGSAFEKLAEAQQAAFPFDAELISRSIEALLSDPQKKLAHMQYLDTLTTLPIDEGLKALINAIQLALFSDNLSQLGQNLDGIYRQMWEAIVAGVKTEGEQSL